MIKILMQFLAVAAAVLVLDMVWLGYIMKDFYSTEIGTLMRRNEHGFAPRLGAAFLVYLMIPAGLVFFVGPRLGVGATLGQAMFWGALFGLITYGIYDFSNLAVLEKWNIRVSLVDVCWGMTLCGTSTVVMQMVTRWWAG